LLKATARGETIFRRRNDGVKCAVTMTVQSMEPSTNKTKRPRNLSSWFQLVLAKRKPEENRRIRVVVHAEFQGRNTVKLISAAPARRVKQTPRGAKKNDLVSCLAGRTIAV
jgi:hypothetical protein